LAAAASPATVLQTSAGANAQITNAPEHTGSSPAIRKPVEVDLADSKAEAYRRDSTVSLFVRLEELDPGDPGQLSGVLLRIVPGCEFPVLNVEIGDSVRWPAHCLGYLEDRELTQFANEALAGKVTRAWLRELYGEGRPDVFSGMALTFNGTSEPAAPQIRVQFASGHCLGVLRGELVATFLQCVRDRCAERVAA
jgi:hypothetical protein